MHFCLMFPDTQLKLSKCSFITNGSYYFIDVQGRILGQ